MYDQEGNIRAAYITGIFAIVATVVAGIFGLIQAGYIDGEVVLSQPTATPDPSILATLTTQANRESSSQTLTAIDLMYERAKGNINLGSWDDALRDLQAVFNAQPNYKDVQALLTQVRNQLQTEEKADSQSLTTVTRQSIAEQIIVQNNSEFNKRRNFFCVGEQNNSCLGFELINDTVVYQEMYGVGPAICIHPQDELTPAQVFIPLDNYSKIELQAISPRGGSSLVEIWVDSMLLNAKTIDQVQWIDIPIDLANNVNEVEVRHIATGWSLEHLCLHIEVVD